MATENLNSTTSETEASPAGSECTALQKFGLVYRCRKCRRIIAYDDNVVTHERGRGRESFKWKKRRHDPVGKDVPAECSSIFVEPMEWMQTVQDGFVGKKLLCVGCNARLGSFNWAGMQCNCGAWVNPAFQLHKSRLDESPL